MFSLGTSCTHILQCNAVEQFLPFPYSFLYCRIRHDVSISPHVCTLTYAALHIAEENCSVPDLLTSALKQL